MRTAVPKKAFSAHLPACPGFTLFELLAVLTVISIGLMVIVGAYGSWGTTHALTGATRIVETGLQQARSLAMTKNAYVAFEYGNIETNTIKSVTGFQLFLCTNDNAEVAEELSRWTAEQTALDMQHVMPAAPYQRLTGHVRIGNVPENGLGTESPSEHAVLFFRPDGGAWSWEDRQAHYLYVYTKERFARRGSNAEPLLRILRIDLATGFISLIKPDPEVTP